MEWLERESFRPVYVVGNIGFGYEILSKKNRAYHWIARIKVIFHDVHLGDDGANNEYNVSLIATCKTKAFR